MALPWIVQSKISRPSLGDAHVRRRLLPDGPLPRAIMLVAGPGYGKTSGLVEVAERAAQAGYLPVWMAFDELDRDPIAVFAHLLAAVRLHVPAFGAETEAVLGAAQIDMRVLWQVFFQELAAYNAEPGFLLLFDDVHHLLAQLPDVAKGLFYFADRLPAGVVLALAARTRLPLPYARLASRGGVMLLGPEALRLSRDEAAALWQARTGSPPPAGWEDRVDRYEGWPLGIAFAAAASPEQGATHAAVPRSAAALAAYVAEEFYLAQPEALRAFMVCAAMLPGLSHEACEQILGVADAPAGLDRLEAAQLLERTAVGAYRFPTYLREFLAEEALRALSAEDRAALHARAGTYYQAQGRLELAFAHLTAGGDWPRAVALCRELAPMLLARGRASRLEHWLAAFPPEAQADPWVQHGWGLLAWRAGDRARASAHFERALTGFCAAGDVAGEVKAVVRLFTIATHLQDEAAMRVLAPRAGQLAAAGTDADRADLWLAEAMAAEQRGDQAAWQAANEAVLALPGGACVEVAQCTGIACLNLFTVALHQGDLRRARRFVEEAQAIAGRWEFGPEQIFAAILRAHLAIVEGALDEAGGILRGLPGAWEEALDWHDRACALTTFGAYHAARGDCQEAERALARSAAIFEKAGFPLGARVPFERLAWLEIQRRRPARAIQAIDAAGQLAATSLSDLGLRLARARAQDLAGDPAGATAALAAIAAEARTLGAPLARARAHLYEAAARWRTGDTAGGRKALEAGLAEAEAGGYGFLREQDAQLWHDLGPLLSPPAPGAPGCADTDAATATSAAMTPDRHAAPAGDEPLDIRLFDRLELRLGGVLLDRWVRRKAKVLVAALALYPRGLSAVQLAEILEERTGKLDGVQACVSALRRMLEPGLDRGARSRYLPLDADRYVLVPQRIDALDVRAFRDAMARGESTMASDPASARRSFTEALAWYCGDLLAEPFLEVYFEPEREAFRRQAVAALTWLVARHVYEGDEPAATACLARAVAIAPCDEAVALAGMRHHATRKDPARVRNAYWDYRKAMHSTLGLAPAQAFEATYRELLAQAGGT